MPITDVSILFLFGIFLMILLIAVRTRFIQQYTELFAVYSTCEDGKRCMQPCISKQLQLLNRITELLINDPNSVPLQKYQWILWHQNLTSSQIDEIEKNIP